MQSTGQGVIDSLGSPLNHAQVSVGRRREPVTLTDSVGRFRLDGVVAGDVLLGTGAIGYEGRWHHLHLVPGQQLEVTLVMGGPISPSEDPVVVESICSTSGCRKP
jgi:hypothetical protein